VIPRRSNNRKHLATFKGHLRYMTVRKYDGTLCRKWRSYKDIDGKFLNSSV